MRYICVIVVVLFLGDKLGLQAQVSLPFESSERMYDFFDHQSSPFAVHSGGIYRVDQWSYEVRSWIKFSKEPSTFTSSVNLWTVRGYDSMVEVEDASTGPVLERKFGINIEDVLRIRQLYLLDIAKGDVHRFRDCHNPKLHLFVKDYTIGKDFKAHFRPDYF